MSRSSNLLPALLLAGCYLVVAVSSPAQEVSPGILAIVENDKDYIAPGESDTLWVRIINPADSDVVVKYLAVVDRGREDFRIVEEHPDITVRDSYGCPMQRRFSGARSLHIPRYTSNEEEDPCYTESMPGIPLHPGESTRVPFREIEVSLDAPPGTVIEYSQTRFRLFDQNDRRLPDTYPDGHFVRIIAPESAQDAELLAGYVTSNPMAGSASVQMSLQLDAPAEVVSGEDWTIRATVTNHGTETMTVGPTLSSPSTLGPRYRSLPCRPAERCENLGPRDIAAGETATLEIFMLPASSIIRPGIWDADSPALRVRDSLGREAMLYAEPLRVVVTSESHLPRLAPDYKSIRGL